MKAGLSPAFFFGEKSVEHIKGLERAVILDKRRSRADPGSIVGHRRCSRMDPGTPLRSGQDDVVFS
jgi:hypothetical protein